MVHSGPPWAFRVIGNGSGGFLVSLLRLKTNTVISDKRKRKISEEGGREGGVRERRRRGAALLNSESGQKNVRKHTFPPVVDNSDLCCQND